MTIGYVLDDTLDKSDGVQQAMIAIAEKMRSLGHDVHYIVPSCERTDLSQVHRVGRVISLKFNGNSVRTPIWSSRKKIKQLFNDYNFDVIHVQMPYSPIMASKVIMLAPKNTLVIGTFHILPYNFLSSFGTKLIGIFMRRSLNRFDKMFAVSRPALEFMKNSFKVDGSIMPNPINYDYFHRFSFGQKDKTKTRIVFVGRFDERKGVKQLVSAYEMIQNKDNVELIMCGKGPLWDSIKSKVENQKLNVQMPGFVSEEEKARYLASANIAVLPSTSGEAFGIVLTEAMSAGAEITIGGNNP
ncbi:MAG: glycosyltransferase family 4 protein, partial [Candidatus Zixiibacteriota bacterium]